ncbi:MAG: YggT family protein [Solirubrobacteraceae bacterium]
MTILVASMRASIAGYLSTLIYIYIILIFAYVLLNILFQLGFKPPYTRITNAFLTLLRDMCEPLLRGIRRLVPSFGGLDLSPLIAIILLQLINSLLVQGVLNG